MVMMRQESDQAVKDIAAALAVYEQTHPAAACFVYRYNPAAIRVKIVDHTFHGQSKGERHDYAWGFLRRVTEDSLAQISILLCLEPGEQATLDVEFQEPIRFSP
ncbi:MAG: hypothetical protein HOP18_24070 [Deltaproteobacteria bacterium]|nr:hypothetical protein [Deltaproteobacteria bacterium]